MDKPVGQSPNDKRSKSTNRIKNYIGCLMFLIMGMFCFFLFYPFHLAYQKQRRVEEVKSVAESIRTALADYAEKHPDNRYPEDIPDYTTLRTIVNKHGGSLPEKQSAATI